MSENIIDDGGNAFPLTIAFNNNGDCLCATPEDRGMTLRDYFAANASSDEVQDLKFKHLSEVAKERITGMKCPERPLYKANDLSQIDYQLAEFEFECAVNAAIRYKIADAMLKARR